MQSAESVELAQQQETQQVKSLMKATVAQVVKTVISCHSCSPMKVIDHPVREFGYEMVIGKDQFGNNKTRVMYFCNELELNEWKERYELKLLPNPVATQHQQ